MKSLALRRVCSLALAALLVLTMSPLVAPPAQAADGVVEIGSVDALIAQVRLSQTDSFEGTTLKLTSDINLSGADVDAIIKQMGHLSFGSSSTPFKGTFDGQGHTITGLNYNRELFVPAADTGLFAQTQGATIKNLVVQDAYVGADFRGGVLVGLAQDTRIENVTLIDCTSSVTPANNAVSLITNAGLAGGVLAGELSNSTVYNCEVRGGRAINTSTAAITALGGEGLYLGALAGTATGSTIEYCRVIPTVGGTAQAPTYTHTQVSNKYDIAVGAVSGQAVYAGGVVGEIDGGTQVLDCFSTADCYTYCATYVSVGAGNVGYVGGIAAAAYGSSCTVARSHYAGNLHSQQYNAVLVIPIIQKNVNLAGLVQKVSSSVSVTDSYYKPTASNEAGITKKILAVGSAASGSSFGPQNDERYTDRTFWEGHGFDFAGGTHRTSAYDADHVNEWTMDLNLGMPVHGVSVKTSLDFPGAGSVSLGSSSLSLTAQTTATPGAFALQGYTAADTALALTATTNPKDATVAGSAENGGYRFVGWYREPGVTVNQAQAGSGFFKDIVAQGNLVSRDAETAIQQEAGFGANDLFAAHYQAQVLFHDVTGDVIDAATGAANATTDDDWYEYAQTLPTVPTPTSTGGGQVSASATLIGWTTAKYDGTGAGWPAITSTELANLRASGTLYAPGDAIAKPLDLYPVYADYSSNIITVFEGNEQDGDARTSMREDVGSTSVATSTAPDGTPAYTITVAGIGTDGAFPAGYRFLGWYETRDGVDVRVSREQTYTLPTGVDLTQEHTYTARFEYRVQYWSQAQYQDSGNYNEKSALYATRWERYLAPFTSLAGPAFMLESFAFWTTTNHSNTVAYNGTLVAPLDVYAHDTYEGSGSKTGYSAYIATDFPGGSTITQKSTTLGNLTSVAVTPNAGMNFLCWTAESDAALAYRHDVAKTPTYAAGTIYTAYNYAFVARLTANVGFHHASGAIDTVTRRYEENVFLNANAPHAYTFLYHNDTTGVSTTSGMSPTPAAMQRDGYRFLGWMDKGAIAAGTITQAEWDYVFDVTDDTYCTSDSARALPYVLADDAQVTRPMDLYPVYAKYDIHTTTNVARAGVPSGAGIAVPPDPTYTTVDNDDGTLTLTLTADVSTPVSSGSTTLYELTSLTLEQAGLPTQTLTPNVTGGNVFSFTVTAGPRYTFVANYTPLAVVYHLDATQTDAHLKNTGETLGAGPQPMFDLAAIDAAAGTGAFHVFAGWTAENPGAIGYALVDGSAALALPTDVVVQPLELWPAYRETTVQVQANIDAALSGAGVDPASVRSLSRTGDASLSADASAASGYEFSGWYTGFVDTANPGTLVTSAASFTIDGEQLFGGTTYTAVYQAVHEVRYHDTHGAILTTVGVSETQPRSFVQEVEVPVLDDQGNQTGTKMAESMIDAAPYQAIVEQLDAECQDSPTRESFSAWQWVKTDGTTVAWDAFSHTTISEDMDLYPVTWQSSALDATGTTYTPKLTWQFNFNTADTGADTAPVQAYLREPYAQPTLTVTVGLAAYGAGGAATVTPQPAVVVTLYDRVDATAQKIGQQATDTQGQATFAFMGTLTLHKVCNKAQSNGHTFAFTVTGEGSTSDGTGIIGFEEQTVFITCAPQDDGSVGGSTTISLPYGTYTVVENGSWAWRTTPTYEVFDLGATVAREDTNATVSSAGATVTCTNSPANGSWIDGDDRTTNVFG